MRRIMVRKKRARYAGVWPIDERACKPPEGWKGWPDGKKFALVLIHDVDTVKGYEKCYYLIKLEERLGFRSSFNFVPKRYSVSSGLIDYLNNHGFEVGVHGLYHDGKLYNSKEMFFERAKDINKYLKEWNAVGFRSPSMQHNLEWIHELDIEYDFSTFDTDPFESQPDGVQTIFPFYVHKDNGDNGYVELPYTLPQDFTLFVLMKETDIGIWKQKLDWVAEQGGMALLNTHPDYMNFSRKPGLEEYPSSYYEQFLKVLETKYSGQYWKVLPRDVARFWVKSLASIKSDTK